MINFGRASRRRHSYIVTRKMKINLYLCTLLLCCNMTTGCVSAWMTTGTGVRINDGMERSEVHKILGSPVSTGDSKDFKSRSYTYKAEEIRLVDVHLYKGKVNTVDEGSGQAIMNALTLGTAEVIMIPMTAAEIAIRSSTSHKISVAYDDNLRVIDSIVTDPDKD